MSGNPFRKSQYGLPVSTSTATTSQISDTSRRKASTSLGSETSARTEWSGSNDNSNQKRVRIETPPPLSPELPPGELQTLYAEDEAPVGPLSSHSPPLLHAHIDEPFPNKPVDPAEPARDKKKIVQDAEVVEHTRRNSETVSIAREDLPSAMIANPFRRTLATIEGTKIPTKSNLTPADGDRLTINESRLTLDVNSFKQMLLTGSTDSAASVKQFSPSHFIQSDASYPSTTRLAQSTGKSRESKAISQKDLHLIVDEMESTEKPDAGGKKKPKPPPPAPRASKSLSSKGPQTVSFDDFAATESSPIVSKQGPKPLPKLPSEESFHNSSTSRPLSTYTPTNDKANVLLAPSNVTTSSSEADAKSIQSTHTKVRPPPPLARRASEKKSTELSRRRANSTQSERSEISFAEHEQPNAQPSKSQKAPPPPPARRAGNVRGNGIAQAQSRNSTENRQTLYIDGKFEALHRSDVTPDTQKIGSVNDKNITSPAIDKRPSCSVTTRTASASISTTTTTTTTTTIATPPPVPVRQRSSSENSSEFYMDSAASRSPIDSVRTDEVHFRTADQDETTESRQYAMQSHAQSGSRTLSGRFAEIADSSVTRPANNVLAEMTALQAEVDALREQHRQPPK